MKTLTLIAVASLALAQSDPWLERIRAGNSLRQAGDLAGAEKQYLAALAHAEGLGKNHIRVGWTLNNLASLYQDQHDYAKAEPMLVRALAIQEQAADSAVRAQMLNNLAVGYAATNRFSLAESTYRRAIAISEALPGVGQVQLVYSLADLGMIYLNAGRLDDAEPLLRRAHPLAERLLPAGNLRRARVLLFLGDIDYAKRRYSAADEAWSRALVMVHGSSGAGAAATAATLRMNLGELRRFERRFAEAESLLSEAVAAFERLDDRAYRPILAAALNHLALTCFEQGKLADAERLYGRALATVEQSTGRGRKGHAVILGNLATLRFEQREFPQAEELLRTALEIVDGGNAAKPAQIALRKSLLRDYAEVVRALGRRKEASKLEKQANAIVAPESSPHTIDLRELRRAKP